MCKNLIMYKTEIIIMVCGLGLGGAEWFICIHICMFVAIFKASKIISMLTWNMPWCLKIALSYKQLAGQCRMLRS